MSTLKTHKGLLYAALVMTLVFGVILIVHYVTKNALDPTVAWTGFAAMALVAIAQLMIIRDKKGTRK